MNDQTMVTVPGLDLVLGDHVRVEKGPYGWATVVKIDGNDATLFRVFVHIGEFVYTGGVLHYTGTETFTIALEGRSYDVDALTHERMSEAGALK